MTFLDSSVIIGYLDDDARIVEYVDEETTAPYFTSVICVYEVLIGPVKSDQSSSLVDEREAFGWVRALDLNERIAMEANRMQDRLTDEGAQMPGRDVLIAATARSTGDKLVVADRDFDAERLREFLDVVQLVEE
jgi:predicted nucleic acid-binding protein